MASILGIDYGSKRIGVAIAHDGVAVASPLTTIENSDDVVAEISKLAADEEARLLVVGLPRNLEGDDTGQTREVRQFASNLEANGYKVALQDEAGTTNATKSGRADQIDARAASIILNDYLIEQL